MLVFNLERYQTRFLVYFTSKDEIKKFHNFGRNNGLTPLENCQFFGCFFNPCFYGLKMLVFYVERYQSLFFGVPYLKRRDKEIS